MKAQKIALVAHDNRKKDLVAWVDLMCSASEHLDFLSARIQASLRFFPERTSQLHRQDRVGIYGSLYLAEVQ